MKRRMHAGKSTIPAKSGDKDVVKDPESFSAETTRNPESKHESIKDPKSASPTTRKKSEPDVFPTRKRPAGLKERLRNVRI